MECKREFCDNRAMWPPYDVCELCSKAFMRGDW